MRRDLLLSAACVLILACSACANKGPVYNEPTADLPGCATILGRDRTYIAQIDGLKVPIKDFELFDGNEVKVFPGLHRLTIHERVRDETYTVTITMPITFRFDTGHTYLFTPLSSEKWNILHVQDLTTNQAMDIPTGFTAPAQGTIPWYGMRQTVGATDQP